MSREEYKYQIRFVYINANEISNTIEPNETRREKLNKVNQFFDKLEQSILKEGIRNPVILTAQNGRLINRYGGSRVMIAQKLNIEVPAIVADFDDRFPEGQLLTSKNQMMEKFKDPPRKILFKHYGINVSGCEHYHLKDKAFQDE